MQLVEQHIINYNSKIYSECDSLCFKSKNLYNSSLYLIRQEFINNNNNVINNLHHLMKHSEQYKELPAKASSTVLLTIQRNFKSFFKSLDSYKKKPSKFKGRPSLPNYLDKVEGRFFVSYTNQAISKKVFKATNKIKLSKTNIEFKTKITDFNIINCVRIIPKLGYFIIEVVYTIPDMLPKENNGKYLSIDLGVNNLATIVSNVKGIQPEIINGKPLKSINQYYNKKKSNLKSILENRNGRKKSKRTQKLEQKRKEKIDNYLHKSSKLVINKLLVNNINTLVIGKNKEWKQDINIGSKNNQTFVSIPHSRFIFMLKYKCERSGINVIITEESYTSKCSFLDLEPIKKHQTYQGKRISRGMFKSSTGRKINADVNGGYNILRKAIPNIFDNGIEGLGVNPKIITILKK
jgi:putative transposase